MEFFWDKIKSFPESELSAQEKDEVFMRIAVHAAGYSGYPDVLEFCFSQISPDRYSELLKRDLEKNGYYGSLNRMKYVLNFDKFHKLFNCLKSSEISKDDYRLWLKFMIKDCSEHYLGASVEVFMHMWTKEGFDNHCTFILDEERWKILLFKENFQCIWLKKVL